MASAQILQLLNQAPIGDFPDVTQIISATSPDFGRLSALLLDPAVPAIGSVQYLAEVKYPNQGNVSKKVIFGRWITRPLPAQTISSGNWTFYGVQQLTNPGGWGGAGGTAANTIWGFTVAQWRQGTGVVARFLDSPTGGSNVLPTGASAIQRVASTTVAGASLTLSANDQVVVEVWGQVNDNTTAGTSTTDMILMTNGRGLYQPGQVYSTGFFTDTAATLRASVPIVFS